MISFTVPQLLARLREAEARACGLYNIMPYGAQIILTKDDLKGVLI